MDYLASEDLNTVNMATTIVTYCNFVAVTSVWDLHQQNESIQKKETEVMDIQNINNVWLSLCNILNSQHNF